MSIPIAKNALLMVGASVGQKIIAFAYFTLIARMIGPESTGKYFFALSFSTIFVVFVDLGFTNVLIREAAKTKEKMQQFLSTVLALKVVFGATAYAAMVVAINLLGYPEETKHLVYLSGVTMLFDSLHLTLYGALRSRGDLRYEAISIPISQFLSMILGTVFLFLRLPLVSLIGAFTIPSFVNVCFAGWVLRRRHGVSLWPQLDRSLLSFLGRIALPFALAAIFARIYSYIDSILLSKMVGDVAVGWYSIPYKITFAFQFIPLALSAALYPRLSEYFASSRDMLVSTFAESFKYLILVAAPIAVGIAILSEPIIDTLYGTDYYPSIQPLRILVMSLLFSFPSFPIGAMLNACNRQKTQTAIVGVTLLSNIFLNIFLIPRYSIVGAAVAAFAGNAFLAIAGFIAIRKIVVLPHKHIFSTLLRTLVAAGIMGVVVFLVRDTTSLFVAIFAGFVVYTSAIFIMRVVTRSQIQKIFYSLFRSGTI